MTNISRSDRNETVVSKKVINEGESKHEEKYTLDENIILIQMLQIFIIIL